MKQSRKIARRPVWYAVWGWGPRMDAVDPHELLTKTICRTKQLVLRALCMSFSKRTSPHLLSQASYLNNNHNRVVKHAILKKAMVNYSVSLPPPLGKPACFPLGVSLPLLKTTLEMSLAVPCTKAQLPQPFCAYCLSETLKQTNKLLILISIPFKVWWWEPPTCSVICVSLKFVLWPHVDLLCHAICNHYLSSGIGTTSFS